MKSKIKKFIVIALSIMAAAHVVAASPKKPNVLFLAIDDLNDWISCMGGHPQVKTPNLDKLAARGTLFLNAHCQSPLCNPSRTSVMLGLRPSTTGVYSLQPAFRTIPGQQRPPRRTQGGRLCLLAERADRERGEDSGI